MIAIAELVAHDVLEMLLRLKLLLLLGLELLLLGLKLLLLGLKLLLLRVELLLKLLQLELAEDMHEALMGVVLRHLLAMRCSFELHPPMLERRQRLVPFVHISHELVDRPVSYIEFLC